MRGTIMLLIIVITKQTTRTISKSTQRASHGRVKNPCDESQYTASSNRVLSKHIRSVHQNKKYTCENCQFSTNSVNFLHIHEENSHNKREVTVHGGVEMEASKQEFFN